MADPNNPTSEEKRIATSETHTQGQFSFTHVTWKLTCNPSAIDYLQSVITGTGNGAEDGGSGQVQASDNKVVDDKKASEDPNAPASGIDDGSIVAMLRDRYKSKTGEDDKNENGKGSKDGK